MRNRGWWVAVAVGVCLVAGAAQSGFAQSGNTGKAFVGTWKLDTAKSDFGKMPVPKSETIWIMSATPTAEKWKMNSVDASGKSTDTSYSGAADDKYYPIKGDPEGATFAFLKNGGYQVKGKDGTVLETGTAAVSDDGKMLTLTTVRHTADGDMNSSAVYTKEK